MTQNRLGAAQEQRIAVQTLKRNYLKMPPTITMSSFQAMAHDVPARGPVWISRDSFCAPPEDDIRTLLNDSIRALATSGQQYPPLDQVPMVDVRLEWLGRRPGAGPKDPEPKISEHDKFVRLVADARRPLTVLYMHGGAFYVGSPVWSRPATVPLAGLTGARIASIAYRLSPQSPFPYALLDVLVAYLSLLSPAAGAQHEAVPPSSIVLAGDSAGGNLGLALIQVLLDQRRRGKTSVRFNGRQVPLDLPAGSAFLSPGVDYANALPSWNGNKPIDFLEDRPHCYAPRGFAADDVWPSTPPRSDIYADPSMYTHPLVCAALAPSWAGAPPIWLAAGEERLLDSIKAVTQRIAADGVSIEFSQAEGLPHIFPVMLNKLPQSQACLKDWASACVSLGEGRGLRGGARIIRMPGDVVEPLDVTALTSLTSEDIIYITKQVAETRKPWTGPETTTSRM